jgi:hypothetical protein
MAALRRPQTSKQCGGRYLGGRSELFEGGHLFFIQDPGVFDRIVAFLEGDLDG